MRQKPDWAIDMGKRLDAALEKAKRIVAEHAALPELYHPTRREDLAMPRDPKVTLTLTEADARWLHMNLGAIWCRDGSDPKSRIQKELKHALAECEC